MEIKLYGLDVTECDLLRVYRIEAKPGPHPPSAQRYPLSHFRVLNSGDCGEADATPLAELWNLLPDIDPSREMRCHEPGFAFQVLIGGGSVFNATLCFLCNNIGIYGAKAPIDWRRFDAKAPMSSALLKHCQRIVGGAI